MSLPIRTLVVALALACGPLLAACEDCSTSRDCSTGQVCIEGNCESPEPFDPDDDDDDTGTDVDSDTDVDTDADTDTDTDDPYGIEWIEIDGGVFIMGNNEGLPEEQPEHEVTVPAFEMTRSEITVIQYSDCYGESACTAPETGPGFNWEVPGNATHPINGVTWEMAVAFCAFAGGRLPSESEWEYAARSGGQDLVYPWGDQTPSCEYCVMNEDGELMGCGENGTMPVCTIPAGNTEQGLCDMSGSVYEWIADYYYDTYAGAPADGSAQEEPLFEGYIDRVLRSGSYQTPAEHALLRTTGRIGRPETLSEPDLGFRCARDLAK